MGRRVMSRDTNKNPLGKLGKYFLHEEIGVGSMGAVYRAYDPLIDRFVALKTLHHDLMVGPEGQQFLARFQREVQAAGRCNHSNIVQVYDYGEDQGRPFIAMEFIEGEPLSKALRGRPIGLAVVNVVMMQLLAALKCAHNQNVIHRDIKPANLMMQSQGQLKVTDFGIASLSRGQTLTMQTVGTPSYMAPEQFLGHKPTPASDLYSAAVIMYEMLAGLRPFRGPSLTELIHQVTNDPLPPLPTLVPHPVRQVVYQAASRDPASRYLSAKAFAQALYQAFKAI